MKWLSLKSFMLVAAVTAFAATTASFAETYPSATIRIVVGFGPGSSADTLARTIGRSLETKFGQPVIIENRPGNSSMTAAEVVSRAPPDGYTLFMATVAQTLNPTVTGLSFDLAKQMVPITLLGVSPNVLVGTPSVPAQNFTDLIALARSNPGSLSFGTSGNGTASHIAAELFNQKLGTKIVTVHYQGGSSQSVSDLLAGHIKLMFNVAVTLAPHVKDGTLRAFAVGQSSRTPSMPDVPTMEELGMPGFDVGVWMGLLAPAGTPPDIVAKLSTAANEALNSDAVTAAMKAGSIDRIGGTPQEFEDFIRKDQQKWSSLLDVTGLRR